MSLVLRHFQNHSELHLLFLSINNFAHEGAIFSTTFTDVPVNSSQHMLCEESIP